MTKDNLELLISWHQHRAESLRAHMLDTTKGKDTNEHQEMLELTQLTILALLQLKHTQHPDD
jgi:hypothetical protein